MAYAVRWQIDFVARNKDRYRLEVLQDGWDDEITYLRGAEKPIETNEDNSEDIFTPIRRQTGSLRIADNGLDLDGNAFDYTDMLPTSTFGNQVRLWQVGRPDTLRWVGYMRPDSLTSRIFEHVSIREFQIVCPLGTLYELPVSFTNTKNNFGTVKTMGQILYYALRSVNVEWANVYKQNNVQHREDLVAKVSMLNFLNTNAPRHSTPSPSDIDTFTATWEDESTSWGSVIEEVCKFWGWTLYSRGYDIYIIAQHQAYKFARFEFDDLKSTDNSSMNDIADVDVDFDNLTWVSTNHTESRKLGYRQISIEADVNAKAEVINPDFQKLEMSYYPAGQVLHQSNNYQYILQRFGPTGSQTSTQTQYIDNYQISEIRPSGLGVPCVAILYDNWANDDFPDKTQFNFKKGICCYIGGQTSQITYFVKTLEDVCIPLNSCISINSSVERDYNPDPDQHPGDTDVGNRTIYASLRIGDLYWDGYNNVWSSTSSTFPLSVRSDGSITAPQNTFGDGFHPSGILFDNHYGSKGHCIYVASNTHNSQGLCGRVKLSIFTTADSSQLASHTLNCVLNSLSLSIYNQDSKLNPVNKDSHTYEGIASTRFKDSRSVSLKLASGQQNTYGKGQLYNGNFALLTTVPFRSGSFYQQQAPEARLLEMMRNVYATVTEQNIIEIGDDMKASSPIARMRGHWSGEDNFRPLCCAHDWAEGTMKLTIINK